MLKRLSFSVFILIIAFSAKAATGYDITVKVKGFENKDLILGYHYRSALHVKDTVRFDNAGVAIFKGDDPLPGGVYLLYFPNGRYYDMMIDKEQSFTLESDTIDFLKNAKITGSNEVEKFFELQLFMEEQGKQAAKIREEYQAAGDNESKKEQLNAQSNAINDKVKSYWEEIEKNRKGSLIAAFVKALQEPVIPKFDIPEGTNNPDSVLYFKQMHFVKEHYFDNIDLANSGLIRTPFFQQKLEYYFNTALLQIPDTIADAAIKTIEKSRPDNEMFRYLIPTIFNLVNESKIMGMEAAMVAVADKYYLSGEADWATEEFIADLRKRVTEMRPTLLGKTAHDLKMESPSGEFFRLHEVRAAVTILIFYEPDCSHCKTEIPKLYKEIFLKYKDRGVQVFAVYNLVDKEMWTKFIDDNGMYEWINVYDQYQTTGFRQHFDIKSTPMIYVLDKDKKIVGKRIDVEQLSGFLDHTLKK